MNVNRMQPVTKHAAFVSPARPAVAMSLHADSDCTSMPPSGGLVLSALYGKRRNREQRSQPIRTQLAQPDSRGRRRPVSAGWRSAEREGQTDAAPAGGLGEPLGHHDFNQGQAGPGGRLMSPGRDN